MFCVNAPIFAGSRRTSIVAREAGLGLGPETSGSPLGSGAFILSLPKGRKLVAANVELPRQSSPQLMPLLP